MPRSLLDRIEGRLVDANEGFSCVAQAAGLSPEHTEYRFQLENNREMNLFLDGVRTGVTLSKAKKGDEIEVDRYSDGEIGVRIKGRKFLFFSSLKHEYSGRVKYRLD